MNWLEVLGFLGGFAIGYVIGQLIGDWLESKGWI